MDLADVVYIIVTKAKFDALEAVAAAARVVASRWLPIEQDSVLSAEGVDLLEALNALDKEAGDEAERDRYH